MHAHLGVGNAEAKFLARYASYRYRGKAIPKRRGGVRLLLVPDDRLKYVQRNLLELLEPLYKPRAAAHGFIKARSPITNANAHQARPYLLNLDLENYFGSISRNRVRGMLQAIGLPHDVVNSICDICVANNQLPQGAPTSPLLANMISFRLDKDLTRFAKANRLRYTRYADDLTFSSYVRPTSLFSDEIPSAGRIATDALSPELVSIISSNAFQINPDKARYSDAKARKVVTGLIVNEFTNVRRTFLRDLRAGLFKVETLGIPLAQADYAAKYGTGPQLHDVLRGRLEWLAQVRGRSFAPYRSLASRFNVLFPLHPLPIEPTNDDIIRETLFVLEYGTGKHVHQGTAFFLQDVGLVSAYHVLDGMPDEWAELFRPHEPTKKFKAKFGPKVCKHRDLAILEHDVPLAAQPSLKPAAGADRVKTAITALGFPGFAPGDGLSERTGKIVARSTKSAVRYVEVDAILSDGFSGGPIINDRSEVVGVSHKGGPEEAKQLAIDVTEVLNLAGP